DARRILLGLFEHVADTACADADEHFDEVRTGNGEERHIGFASNRTRKQRLTGTGRANEQNAPRNLAAKTLELLRIAQEFDDFLKILLGFVHTGNILESNAAMRFRQKLGLRLTEAHRTARTTLHLAHEENPHAEDQDHRQPRQEKADQRARTTDARAVRNGDLLAFK